MTSQDMLLIGVYLTLIIFCRITTSTCVHGRCGKLYCGGRDCQIRGTNSVSSMWSISTVFCSTGTNTFLAHKIVVLASYSSWNAGYGHMKMAGTTKTRCRPPHCRIRFVNSQAGCVTDSQQDKWSLFCLENVIHERTIADNDRVHCTLEMRCSDMRDAGYLKHGRLRFVSCNIYWTTLHITIS